MRGKIDFVSSPIDFHFNLLNKAWLSRLVLFNLLLPAIHDIIKLLAIPSFGCVVLAIVIVVELKVPFEPLAKLEMALCFHEFLIL